MDDAELLPEEGSLVLQKAGEKTWLAHKVTQEKVELPEPPAGETWELCFTEEGVGYVDSGSTSLWTHEQLKLSVYASPDGTTWVSTKTGSQTKTLKDFKADHQCTKIEVPLVVGVMEIHAALFRQTAGGSVWWNLLDVHHGCKLETKLWGIQVGLQLHPGVGTLWHKAWVGTHPSEKVASLHQGCCRRVSI